MALPEALKDAEKAIEVQPEFGEWRNQGKGLRCCIADPSSITVKGYIRKSHVLFAMKEYTKALSAIEQVRL